ncbi:hypothetical protein JKP88DRAFT_263809 [Tribonema minus]|uniref:Uncharacterized protein n=1 Tax=Tribonema minus TaxID=303371 RepID=A0A835YVJ8_9STRA|nr:hypothetical protein JKP88DRAFT_263809 [Tribonema minus]
MPLLSSRKPLHSSPSGNCVKPAADPTTAQDPTPLEQRKRSRSLFDMDQEPQRRRMMIGGSASSAVHHQHQAAEQQLPSVQSMLCCMRGVHQQLKRQDTAAAPRFGSDPPLSGTSPTGYSSPWNCGAPPTHLQQRQARHCDAEQCTLREETRRIARRRHYHALCEHRHSAGPKAGMPLHHHQLEKVRKHQSTHEVQCCRTLASALQTDADTAAALARAGAEAYRPGAWSAAATQALAALVGGGGGGGGAQWTDVARQLTAATGLRASAQQCLLHWRIAVNKGETVAASRAWSVTEDDRLVAVVSVMGVRWPAVARLLPGRDLKQCREHYTNVVLPGGKPRPWPTAPPQSATLSGGAAQPQPRQLLSGFRHPSHSSAGALPVPHYGAAKASVTVNPELQRQPPPPQQQQQRPAAFRAHHHPPPPTAAHYHFGATQLPQAATLNGMRAAVPTFDQRHFGGDVLTMVSSGSPCGGRGAQGAPMPFGSGGRGAYAAAAAPSTAAAGAPPRAFEVVASLLSLRHV